MFDKLIRFIRRPDINEQNTGHEAYQQMFGYSMAGVNGNGGQGVRRSLNACNPANIAVGPTHKLNDPTVTGNNGYTLNLHPLSPENAILVKDTASF